MGNQILFVDDERSILKALERLFIDSDYDLFTAESGEAGLRILAENQIDIVVSDMRMPEMNGHQFLQKVRALYPSTTRLILSGYANESEILNSLIDGSNNLYLFKPWDNEDIKKKIAQIFEARQLYRNSAVLKLINGLENLSLITGIYSSVCRLIDQGAEINAIAKVIETDPAVTAAVLRVVNSAFYNVKTASVGHAITFLGLTVVKSIVLSCSLMNLAKIKVPRFSAVQLTGHSCVTNVFVGTIYAELLKKRLPDSLATAGLLHNLGLPMFLHYFPDTYRQVLEEYLLQNGAVSLTAIEKKHFGVNHAELGGYLLDWWGIPYSIVECALFHQDPLHSAVMDKEAVATVHLADYYAWKAVTPSLAGTLDSRVFSVLNISKRDCDSLLNYGGLV